MIPTKKGQVVKFQTPKENENPNQLYIVLEFIEDGIKSRVKIQPGNSGLSFPPIHLVYAKDLEVDEGQTFELEWYLKHGNHNLFNVISGIID
ncbi:hypothetical protein [uncultured Polaribacter sp.]|uniref:hypothetical protein n=1 Tax=uncultured Polaribacter sp. TaxID=174711 RepID=UPI00260AC15B|nr:hypothetical protein [uncultured Polaribacter sp.]